MLAVDTTAGIHTLTIDRPAQRNPLDDATLEAVVTALQAARATAARAIVLTGAGLLAFSAGSDIKEMAGQTPAERLAHTALGQQVGAAIEAHPAPVIAAIEGYCLGGGLELALACDVRLAGAGAIFGLPELAISALPSWGGTYRLSRTVGLARAKEIALFGRRVDAHEAHAWGLVSEVVEEGGALSRALEMARGFDRIEPATTARLKALLNLGSEAGAALATQLELFADEIQTASPGFDEQARAFGADAT
jgi:enoyl-CoA hydratase/carnithine racemase